MKLRLLFVGLVTLPFAFAQLLAGCAQQGEGQLCSYLNGNDDCQAGLVCDQKLNLCCPPSGGTVAGCSGLITDAGTFEDAGTTSSSSSSSSSASSSSSSGTSSSSTGSGGGGGGTGGASPDAGDGG